MTNLSEEEISDRVNFYVINLDRSIDRMERFEKDFASFPIPITRVQAIEGKSLTIPIKDYDALMLFICMGRPANPGEIGCYFSHLKALRMFLESDKEFALICEDDAMPIPESYEVIKQAITHSHTWDLLRLCGGKTCFPYQFLTHNHSLCTQIAGMTPATAYIVSRFAAEILVLKLVPITCFLDDSLFRGWVGIREATVFPNCIRHSELSGASTIDDSSQSAKRKRNLKPWHLIFWSCRFHRLRVRTIRYSLQIFRLLKRYFRRNPG